MKTKTIYKTMQKNNQTKDYSFYIPKNIRDKIKERWFYLYEWIWAKDVKISIERDFLKYMSRVWWTLAIIIIIPSIIIFFIIQFLIVYLFLWILFIVNILLILFLIIVSIKRSRLLTKNAYVLLTDTHISINWKVQNIDNYDIYKDEDIWKIAKLFEEDVFWESYSYITKNNFFKDICFKISSGYKFIFKNIESRSKNSIQLILISIILYTLYVLSLWFIYFIWIIIIWLFWILISKINKKVLLIIWDKIISINNKFELIDKNSNKLSEKKEEISKLLNDAINNEWKDWLLLKINSWIDGINKCALDSIETSISLKKEIEDSKYKEMFNFSIYNSWIKKQIYEPLKQIHDLLENNLNSIKEKKIEIEKQIENTKEDSLKENLVLNKNRIDLKIEVFEKHISNIKTYLEKLQ